MGDSWICSTWSFPHRQQLKLLEVDFFKLKGCLFQNAVFALFSIATALSQAVLMTIELIIRSSLFSEVTLDGVKYKTNPFSMMFLWLSVVGSWIVFFFSGLNLAMIRREKNIEKFWCRMAILSRRKSEILHCKIDTFGGKILYLMKQSSGIKLTLEANQQLSPNAALHFILSLHLTNQT